MGFFVIAHSISSPGSILPRRALTPRQFLRMPRNRETGLGCDFLEIPQPCPGAAFEIRSVTAEAGACGRAGGDVGHRVEGGGGMFTEFIAIVRV